MTSPGLLEGSVVNTWLAAHPQWRLDHAHLVREVATLDYPGAVRLVEAQVDVAEGLNHHALITLGYRTVRFELWTHDRGGVTQLDLDYAQAFDDLVAGEFANLISG
ncbi:MAG TPA: 4a-hydroxytetrahydrobiopterin dehydratase [Acidimicrobiales bacterium]|nr:4a-hydroxytetrahydrobiopterin dehydratase [Acidimicrobiales bacterium]